jgi:hypothetical protein
MTRGEREDSERLERRGTSWRMGTPNRAPDAQETILAGIDDSGYGLVMFVVFSAAVLFVTGAVALLALVGFWWMLGAAFEVHAGRPRLSRSL